MPRDARVLLALALVMSNLAWLDASTLFAQAKPKASEPAAAPRLTRAPELLEFIEAPYPEAELAEPRDAAVILSVAISATGDVLDAQVVESAGPHFDAAALEAVKQFRLSPAELDGKPASVRIAYRYAFAAPVPELTTGDFRGVVMDRETGAPLANVKIALEGHGEAVTGDDGAFAFTGLPVGTIRVALSREDLTPLSTEETIEAGRAIEARYDIELPKEEASSEDADDLEIVVKAPPQLVRQVVSVEVSAAEASRVPGTQGDVLKVVENLPGIARSSAGSGEIIVWGAAPGDTRTYVGAVRIPMLYHFGGLRSVLHNDAVASVELVPGGYGASYGRGLGGLVLVGRRPLSQDELHGSVQVDLLDASLALTGPISERFSFSASARRSHIDDLGGLLEDQSFQQFFTLPNYYDGQARLRYQATPTESFEVGTMLSGDKQTRTQPSGNPALRTSDRKSLDFQRYDLAYRNEGADGSVLTVAPWYGHDGASRKINFGGIPASVENESHLVGFRAEWRGHVAEPLSATFGLDFEMVKTDSIRSGAITFPPREGDPYVFGRAPADQLNYDQWSSTVVSAAPYVELDWAPFADTLHVVPGLRVEPYLIEAERRRPETPGVPDLKAFTQAVSAQPRLSVSYAPIETLTLRVAGGFYRQPPLSDDLSSVFGNPLVSVSKGQHLLGSVGYRFFDQLSAEVAVFHTRSQDLIARNPSETPSIAEALVQDGEARTVGGQLMLRKDKADSPVFGWVAYTIMRSERRTPSSSPWRLFDYDQTHVLTAVVSYELGLGFEAGLRMRASTGFPRTPVRSSFFDARTNRFEPVLGELNTIRVPMFFQLDARISKRFDWESSDLEIYLDLQNATNRDNAEELAYSPDYSEQRYILGLPILPVLGARWEF